MQHTVHTVFEGKKHVYCTHGNNRLENSYQPISRIVCLALGICASILHTNHGSWLITITYYQWGEVSAVL